LKHFQLTILTKL